MDQPVPWFRARRADVAREASPPRERGRCRPTPWLFGWVKLLRWDLKEAIILQLPCRHSWRVICPSFRCLGTGTCIYASFPTSLHKFFPLRQHKIHQHGTWLGSLLSRSCTIPSYSKQLHYHSIPSQSQICAGDGHTSCGQLIWADLGDHYSHFFTSEIFQLIISYGFWTGNHFKFTARPYPNLFYHPYFYCGQLLRLYVLLTPGWEMSLCACHCLV